MAGHEEAGGCCGGGLRLDPAVREEVRRRLLSVRGHVEGILRMLEDDKVYCVDVLKQMKAVDGALDKAGVKHVVFESQGTAHEWQTWRRALHDFAPRLFGD